MLNPNCQYFSADIHERGEDPEVEQALDLYRWITSGLDQLSICDEDLRVKVSVSLWTSTISHLRGMACLVRSGLPETACALARPDFEALVQAIWIRHCASSEELDRYLRYGVAANMHTLLGQIDQVTGFHGGVMQRLREQAAGLTDYFSIGLLRCNVGKQSSEFASPDILAREVLLLAGCMALSAFLMLAIEAGRVDVADEAFTHLTAFLDAWPSPAEMATATIN